uniref:Uncharacterized protein n=1 Tax=Rhizophora mucronata TaxID=61149 RepID=A0A2P2Q841_RHIMU
MLRFASPYPLHVLGINKNRKENLRVHLDLEWPS